MPFSEAFPFQRVFVDHMILGVTRVWWQMAANFTDPGTHTFQLQASHSGLHEAQDWVDVGSPVYDAWYADDDVRRLRGKVLTLFYRVKLTTARGTYLSNSAGVHGLLPHEDWVSAREYIRKEILRGGKIGRDGLLLKRIRYGAPCTACRDLLTKEVTDSRCPECRGTGFKVGYHPPASLTCWDVSPEQIAESRGGAKPPGQQRNAMVKARVLGFPSLELEDVWVDGKSDQRWYVNKVEHTSEVRGVPITMDVYMDLAPYTDAIYRVPIGDQSIHDSRDGMPGAGAGCVTVTQDYGGVDALSYRLADGCGIEGASVLAFLASDYALGLRTPSHAQAATWTTAKGWWTYSLKLNPGDYVLVYEKPGEYGPNTVELTVDDPTPPASSSSSSSVSSSSSSLTDFGPL